MSVSVTVAGTAYTIPTVGDVSWGPQVTAWIQAISAATLQTSGGTFTLTNDLNFGASFGLISKYFTSISSNAASAGAIRLANTDFIKWRNAANSADLGIQLDASNVFQFGAAINSSGNITGANISGTNSGDLTLAAVGSTPSANGASLSAQVLTLQPADGTHPGLLTSGAQTIGGAKTFTGAISASNLSGTNSGDQTITLTGDVTGSGTGSFAATIAANAVTNSKLATMAANTVKANVTGSSATPTDVALTSAATASAAMIRDANANVQANNIIKAFATTATAGGTTTLTVASSYSQVFTGSSNQTVVLPDCTTLILGFQFYITNRSTGTVTVNKNGGTLVQTMATNTSVVLTCTAIGSAAGSWDVQYVSNAALSNPMTTSGDIIYGGASGSPTRLAANSTATKEYLQSLSSGVPAWAQVAFADLSGLIASGQLYSASSIASSGYIVLPGGLYINWLPSAASSTSGVATNWAAAFPTACFAVAGAVTNASNVTFRVVTTTTNVTLTVSSGTPTISIIAIGN